MLSKNFIPLSKKRLFSKKNAFQLAACCLLLVSCGKNETETLAKNGAAYYPLSVGKTLVYNLDSTIYTPKPGGFSTIDTFSYQVREVYVDTFQDQTKVLNYKIERYVRPRNNTAAEFQINDVFTAALTDDYALRTEGNLKFIKFPTFVSETLTFDGNVFNDYAIKIAVAGNLLEPFSKKWTYTVKSLGKSEKVGTATFTDVLTIEAQSDPRILTEKRYVLEKYAKGIGLIYREAWILDTQKLDATMAWEKKAEKGFILKQTVAN